MILESYMQWPAQSKGEDPSKRVVIVGAGVAGLEAARVAAMCGHRVTLIEREFEVGARC
jgi:NADPH-dependent 2,4-dienoyl-CoA reductase/sulfur reductase-like enzyme